MTVTLTVDELSSLLREQSDWYNAMILYVFDNVIANWHTMDYRQESFREAYHKWCKKYQAEHPRPSWKDLLPE